MRDTFCLSSCQEHICGTCSHLETMRIKLYVWGNGERSWKELDSQMASLSTYINSIPLASRLLIWEEEFLLKPLFGDQGGFCYMPVNMLLNGNKCLTCRQQLITDISVNVMTTQCDGGMMREMQGPVNPLRMAFSPDQTKTSWRKKHPNRDLEGWVGVLSTLTLKVLPKWTPYSHCPPFPWEDIPTLSTPPAFSLAQSIFHTCFQRNLPKMDLVATQPQM